MRFIALSHQCHFVDILTTHVVVRFHGKPSGPLLRCAAKRLDTQKCRRAQCAGNLRKSALDKRTPLLKRGGRLCVCVYASFWNMFSRVTKVARV